MNPIDRLPWTPPTTPFPSRVSDDAVLAVSGDPWSQCVEICAHRGARQPDISHYSVASERFEDGPLAGRSVAEVEGIADGVPLPLLVEADSGRIVCDHPIDICEWLAPELLDEDARERLDDVRTTLVDVVYRLGALDDQAAYEELHAELMAATSRFDEVLTDRRFLGGRDADLSDVLLYTFSIRLDAVYYELYKASIGLLADFSSLEAHAQDLFEQPAFYETTDFERIKAHHYLVEPVLNPSQIVPRGGIPDLYAPHFRDDAFDQRSQSEAVEEDQDKSRIAGEWVRPQSEQRSWIRPEPDATYPAEAGRYHLYAPYNCPWSHRALLGRAVVGLEDVIGASIVYFRRDPERGWQFNPRIPGCTEDLANGFDFVEEVYESVGSDERSVPVLWDTETETIVSNESADILRMFSVAFEELADRDAALYPVRYRDEIDRLNAAVYQRINNGAYKAGFADSQTAYERAYSRYFRALDWLEDLLRTRRWLAGSDRPTEADLRLFPTVFRHDAVYYSRFRLNERRISSYPRLSDWLGRMMDLPGVSEASDLDHARNGYFGRTGNEIVPAGPIPLGLSPKDFSRAVWLNRA